MLDKPRNIYWDTICSTWKWNPQPGPESTRCGRLAKYFKKKEPDPIRFPDALHDRVKRCKSLWGIQCCTPESILKHWDFLKPGAAPKFHKAEPVDESEIPDGDEIRKMRKKRGLI